jgi:hypothetical protein
MKKIIALATVLLLAGGNAMAAGAAGNVAPGLSVGGTVGVAGVSLAAIAAAAALSDSSTNDTTSTSTSTSTSTTTATN